MPVCDTTTRAIYTYISQLSKTCDKFHMLQGVATAVPSAGDPCQSQASALFLQCGSTRQLRCDRKAT